MHASPRGTVPGTLIPSEIVTRIRATRRRTAWRGRKELIHVPPGFAIPVRLVTEKFLELGPRGSRDRTSEAMIFHHPQAETIIRRTRPDFLLVHPFWSIP